MYETLEQIDEVVKKCQKCKLCKNRTNTVFGCRKSKCKSDVYR